MKNVIIINIIMPIIVPLNLNKNLCLEFSAYGWITANKVIVIQYPNGIFKNFTTKYEPAIKNDSLKA